MKRLFFIFPFLLAFMLVAGSASAQEYRTAVGARLGSPLSASLKYFLNDNGHALEAYVGTWGWGWSYGRWVNLSAAYQVHSPLEIEGLEGLYWYYGGGAAVYFWNYNNSFAFDDNYSSTAIGVQGYIGLDYAFEDVPVNISVDWVPTLTLNGYSRGFGGGYGNIGVRYILAQ